MALTAHSDCHPERRRTRFTLRCDRCGAEAEGALPGYATDQACRRAVARRDGWVRDERVGLDGRRRRTDLCAVCATGRSCAA